MQMRAFMDQEDNLKRSLMNSEEIAKNSLLIIVFSAAYRNDSKGVS
jgi:hypothetical protein